MDNTELYNLGKQTIDIFNKLKINYWADGTTAIGAELNNSLKPFDDDMDLAVMEDEFNQHLVKKHLNQIGLDITENWIGFKIFNIKHNKIKVSSWNNHLAASWSKYNFPQNEILRIAGITFNKDLTPDYEYTKPYIDIIPYTQFGKNLITKGGYRWKDFYWEIDSNIKKIKFYDYEINQRSTIDRYIKDNYEENKIPRRKFIKYILSN